MLSTKMTKAGQTSVPKEIRTGLGIEETARVYWFWDGERAYISAVPAGAPIINSKEEFLSGLTEAEESIKKGGSISASSLSSEVRARYGIE